MRACWALILFQLAAWAQPEALRIGNGVLPPRLVSKVEPKFTPEARRAEVQGTVVLGLVVDQHGDPTDIEIISPLGFGLDEESIRTVKRWRFVPGSKDSRPVPIFAQVEVNFSFPGTWTDTTAERRRTVSGNCLNPNIACQHPGQLRVTGFV